MDYVREAIEYLKSYKDLEAAKQNLLLEIRELRASGDSKAINMDGMPHGSRDGGFDDHIVNKMYKLQHAEKSYKETIRTLSKIDKILEEISHGDGNEKHGKLLRMWFIENNKINEIAETLDISDRHVFRVKNVAIRRLAVRLFGINVIK